MRVENLEPFDEYEDFEQKCCHYVLLCASSSSLSFLLDKIIPSSNIIHYPLSPIELECQLEELKMNTSYASVSR